MEMIVPFLSERKDMGLKNKKRKLTKVNMNEVFLLLKRKFRDKYAFLHKEKISFFLYRNFFRLYYIHGNPSEI